jgi:hypothetical protein
MKQSVAALVVLLGLAYAPSGMAAPSDSGSAAAAPATEDRIEKRLGAFSSVALGMPKLGFVNALVGARFELEYTPRFAFGMSLAYANLKGKDGRVSNVLPEISVAYRVPLGDGSFGIPLRFAGGYLAKNGPTLRLTAGFDFELGQAASIELALLEPMVWVVNDRPELSLNLGGAVRARF